MVVAVRVASLACCLLPLIVGTGCSSPGGGPASGGEGATSVSIEFAPQFNVEKAAIAVFTGFTGSGFQFTDRGANRLVFQGAGGLAAQERFGKWFGDGVEVQVEIAITSPEYRTSVLHCVVRKSMSGPAGPWQATSEGRTAFKKLLKDVKTLARVL